ncbi:hypothetical protein ACYSNO_00740 [Enterococcus sp. LJL98]
MENKKKNGWFFSRSILDEINSLSAIEEESFKSLTNVEEDEISKLQNQLLETRYQVEGLKNEKELLHRQLADQKDLFEAKNEDSFHEELTKKFEVEKKELLDELSVLNQMNLDSSNKLKETEQEVFLLRQELLQQEKMKSDDVFHEECQQVASRLTAQLQKSDEKKKELEELLAIAASKQETSKIKFSKELASYEEKNTELKKTLEILRENLKQAEEESHNNVQALQEELVIAKKSLEEKRGNDEKVQELVQKMEGYTKKMTEINLENTKLKEEIENKVGPAIVERLALEIKELKIVNEQLLSENVQLIDEKQKNEKLINDNLVLKQKLEEKKENLLSLTEKEKSFIDEKNKTTLELKQSLQEKTEELNNVTEEFEKLLALSKEAGEDSIEIVKLKEKINDLQEENDWLKEENGEIQTEIGAILTFTRKKANRTLEEAKVEANRILRTAEMQVEAIKDNAKKAIYEVEESKVAVLSLYNDLEEKIQHLAVSKLEIDVIE